MTLWTRLRKQRHVHPHTPVLWHGRLCEVVKVRQEQRTFWCDLSDAETGRTYHVPEHVLQRF